MRVLLVQPHIFAGGAEKAMVYLSYHLMQMGHKVSIVTLSKDLSKLPNFTRCLDYITPKAEEPPTYDSILLNTIPRIIRETNGIIRLIKDVWENYDICVPGNFPAYWSTYPFRKHMPIVWLCSEVLGPYGVTKDYYDKSRVFRFAFKVASIIDRRIVERGIHEIVTCSGLCRAMVKERYKREAYVAHTAVDYELFSQEVDQMEAKKKLGLGDDYVLLHVGSMIKRKNQFLSLQVVKRLISDMPDLRLVFVGDGPHKAVLREEVKRLNLDKHIVFMGEVDEETLKTLYYACDLNLYPVDDQTFGLVPFEALACGKVSVVSQRSGAAILLKGISAAIIADPIVDEIVGVIKRVREGKIDLEEMARRGKRFVKESLTWKAYAKVVNEILKKAHDSFLNRVS